MPRTPKRKPTERPTPPLDSSLISFENLALRWDLNFEVTKRRVREAKIPIIRISYKTLRLRMSDILAFEEQSASGDVPEHQSAKVAEMHPMKAETIDGE